MKKLFQQPGPVTIIVMVLLIPVLPFVMFGPLMESSIGQWLSQSATEARPLWVALITFGLLSADILLPVPSSVVCTWAGQALGAGPGVLVNWLGLNLSCVLGYWIGRSYGLPLAQRFANPATLNQLETMGNSTGSWALILFRGVPVLAEASVLLSGLQRIPAIKFYPPVVAANLGIAIAYAMLGDFSGRHGWFPAAAALACAVPVMMFTIWKYSSGLLSRPVDQQAQNLKADS